MRADRGKTVELFVGLHEWNCDSNHGLPAQSKWDIHESVSSRSRNGISRGASACPRQEHGHRVSSRTADKLIVLWVKSFLLFVPIQKK